MKVRIKRDARYALYGLPHGKMGAQSLAKGDLVDFPDDYAAGLIESGLAEEYMEPKPKTKPKPKLKYKPDAVRHVAEVTADKTFGVGKKE